MLATLREAVEHHPEVEAAYEGKTPYRGCAAYADFRELLREINQALGLITALLALRDTLEVAHGKALFDHLASDRLRVAYIAGLRANSRSPR